MVRAHIDWLVRNVILTVTRDAGLVLSAYLNKVVNNEVQPFQDGHSIPRLPALESLIVRSHLKVLELGAGCGIVGLTLASHRRQESTTIQLTDLPEASSILDRNITRFRKMRSRSEVTHRVLDWSLEDLPRDIASAMWDLILVADCTYNPDVVPDLVKTLKRITSGNSKNALICLAMKVRHDSEMVFFQLMRDSGFAILEEGKVGLPVLEEERQEIEIFIFKDEAHGI